MCVAHCGAQPRATSVGGDRARRVQLRTLLCVLHGVNLDFCGAFRGRRSVKALGGPHFGSGALGPYAFGRRLRAWQTALPGIVLPSCLASALRSGPRPLAFRRGGARSRAAAPPKAQVAAMDFFDKLSDSFKELGKKKKPAMPSGGGHRLGTAEDAAEAARKKREAAEARAAAAAAHAAAVAAAKARSAAPQRNASAAAAAAELRMAKPKPVAPRPPPAAPPAPVAFAGSGRRLGDPAAPSSPKAPPPASPKAAVALPAEVAAQLRGAAALLAQNPDCGRASAELLARLLRNVTGSPLEVKFRRLRLGNPAIAAAVVNASGGMELLEEAGFTLQFEDAADGQEGAAEGWAVLPLPEPNDSEEAAEGIDAQLEGQLAVVAAALASLEPLLPAAPPAAAAPPPPDDAPPPGGRATAVWAPSAACVAALSDLPDDYFTRSTEELVAQSRASAAQRANQQQLSTRAHKERAAGPPPPQPRAALLRVRLPDGMLLQGSFGARESCAALRAWLADALAEPHRTFDLYAPRCATPLPADATTLLAAGLAPAALLSFRWGADEPPQQARTTLRAELAATAVPLE